MQGICIVVIVMLKALLTNPTLFRSTTQKELGKFSTSSSQVNIFQFNWFVENMICIVVNLLNNIVRSYMTL